MSLPDNTGDNLREPKNETLGITLSPAVTLSADWREFVANICQCAADVVLKTPHDAVATGIGSITKLASSIKTECNNGERVWALAVLAFAWSLDSVKGRVSIDSELLRQLLLEGIDKSRKNVERNGIAVPLTFLDRPVTLPLYRTLREYVVSSKLVTNKKELRFKIDAAYSRAVFEIWIRRQDFYAPLQTLLSSPGALSADLSLSWSTYRAKLIYDFDVRPVFGQEDSGISISQLYVPLRGFWPKDGSQSDHESFPAGSHIALVDDTLDRWLDSDDHEDWLRLIGGGPGSGKSTSLKALARRVADLDHWRPLFIPLQYITLDSDLREAINAFFTKMTDGAFTQPPLARASVEDGAPLLLIFDGLDELVAPGEAAKDVVGTFANRLATLVTTLSGGGQRPIKVVVSGRMPAFQAAQRYLMPRINGSIETYGFLPIAHHNSKKNQLWHLDQRPQWWRQYAHLKGESTDVPEAFSNERLSSITHEPLLCYLLALAGYATEHWELAAENRNRIYDALINSVYDRGWGDGTPKRHGPGKTLNKSDFNKLMETFALAAWLGGDTRVASEQAFKNAVVITGAESAWNNFSADNGGDVTNLAMNFYLKSTELSQRGFEFTHKSFGEYLAARALLSISRDISVQASRRPDYALQDWMRATGKGSITSEMMQFMRDEFRFLLSASTDAVTEAHILNIKKSFETLVQHVDTDGFPVQSSSLSWRMLELEQANSECALWATLNACARGLKHVNSPEAWINLSWAKEDGISSILRRVSSATGNHIIYSCLSLISARKQNFLNIYTSMLDFEWADLSDSIFTYCNLFGGNFKNSVLKRVRFYETTVSEVNFSESNLDNVVFHSSKFRSCNFEGAVTNKITVSIGSFLNSSRDEFVTLDSKLHVLEIVDGRSLSEVHDRVNNIFKEASSKPIDKTEHLVDDFGWGREILFHPD